MKKYMQRSDGTFSSLTKGQKEAAGLLSVGTFLEYFDLMLYIHMAVLLNELFFPESNAFATSLVTAFTFCLTFILRPIGALFFGYIGDHVGRKTTVVITTFIMACTCLMIANLPTYTEIGIKASFIMILCRVLQGISSLGETVGAELYLTEFTKPPIQYPIVSFITVCSSLGGLVALIIAHFSISYGLNWRIAFWFGAGIALIGGIARTALKETPEFVDAKRRLKASFERVNVDINKEIFAKDEIINEKVNQKTSLALFLMDCTWPFCFYFCYIHCGSILSEYFHYSAGQIIYHNFIVSIIQLLGITSMTFLSYIIHPIRILKVTTIISLVFIIICPYLLNNLQSTSELFFIQSCIMFFILGPGPAIAIIYKHFPVFKRFTYVSFIFAISRAVIFVFSSFGLIFLMKVFSYWSVAIIAVPTMIGFAYGLSHFEKLERKCNKNLEIR